MTWARTIGLRLLLAFLLSFALWVFVSYTQNPDRRIRFDNVPVEAVGLSSGLVLVDSNGLPRTTRPTINVQVEGSSDDLQSVSERDLRVYQDLSALGPGQYVAAIEVEPLRSDQVRLQFAPDPVSLSVRIEREITSTVPLTVELSGTVPFSFEALEARLTSRGSPIERAEVRGPENRVTRVAAVRAAADIDRLTSTYNSPRALEAIDADGRPVDGVTIDPPLVNVQVPIVSSVGVKRVPIVPQIIGEPASGFVIAGVQVAPQLITLTGSSGPLDDVQSVSTAPLSVAGASATFTRTVALQEPQSARIRFGEPTSAVVTVQIAPLDRPFQVTLPLSVQPVGADPGLLVTFSPTSLPVTLQGRSAALAQIDTSALVVTLNLQGLAPGAYTIAPDLALPAGVQLVAPLPRVSVVLRVPATATPEPTATPEARDTPAPTSAPRDTPAPTSAPTRGTPEPTATATPEPRDTPTPTEAPTPTETATPAAP